jgi:hypothetical protein
MGKASLVMYLNGLQYPEILAVVVHSLVSQRYGQSPPSFHEVPLAEGESLEALGTAFPHL